MKIRLFNKSLLLIFLLFNMLIAGASEECLKYKNYCIKDLVPTYKLMEGPTKVNDQVIRTQRFTGSYAKYAQNYCSSIGYRIPNVDEAKDIVEYLLWVPYQTNHLIWLYSDKMEGFAQALDYAPLFNQYGVRTVRTNTQGVETMCIKNIIFAK